MRSAFLFLPLLACNPPAPDLLTGSFVDPTDVARISQFRSCCGHDYSGGGEDNRSMKHYIHPTDGFAVSNDQMEVMFWADDSSGALEVFPDWRLGSIERVTELRYGLRYSSYRMNLLGDPLSRLDAAPPRVDLFVDGQRMAPGDFLPPASTGDTLQVEALVYDETYIPTVTIRDENLGTFPSDREPRMLPTATLAPAVGSASASGPAVQALPTW